MLIQKAARKDTLGRTKGLHYRVLQVKGWLCLPPPGIVHTLDKNTYAEINIKVDKLEMSNQETVAKIAQLKSKGNELELKKMSLLQ